MLGKWFFPFFLLSVFPFFLFFFFWMNEGNGEEMEVGIRANERCIYIGMVLVRLGLRSLGRRWWRRLLVWKGRGRGRTESEEAR